MDMDQETKKDVPSAQAQENQGTVAYDPIRASIEGRVRWLRQQKEAETEAIAKKVAAAVVAEIKALTDTGALSELQREFDAMSDALQAARAEIEALTDERDALKAQAKKPKQ